MALYRNFEEYNIEVTDDIKSQFSSIITNLGEDVAREGIVKTPERAAKAMQFLTSGYDIDAAEILKGAMFKEDYNDMVVVKTLSFIHFVNTICYHFLVKHILPISLMDIL